MEERAGRPTVSPPLVFWKQLVVGLLLFAAYLLVDSVGTLFSHTRRAAADRHGHDIFALEQWLHIDIEPTLNQWLQPHQLLTTLANYEYASTYIISALALLAWVWFRRPDLWRSTRDSFVVLNVLAIACFAAYPVTPPRLLSHLGFVDTVTQGGTVGSWGWGFVNSANQLAAMPSLHVGWCLWTSVVLARITARRSVQLLSGVHVLLTLFVVMATANHYLLDAVAVVIPVYLGAWFAEWRHGPGSVGTVVPSCDAFFLHVERTGAPQHVGGMVVLEPSGHDPSLEEVRTLVRGGLAQLPRLHQRLRTPSSRWRRPRWVEADVDLDWHVVERRSDDGLRGLHRIVAELAEEPMPRDRPLWRVILVRDIGPSTCGLLFFAHHSIADGFGTITNSLSLFEPPARLIDPDRHGPGVLQRAVAVVVGLAQLATDGAAAPIPGASLARSFDVVSVPLDQVRELARARRTRVTDLVIALTADAMRVAAPQVVEASGGVLRCSVPMMVRAPGSAVEGNVTASVMLDVPCDDRPFDELLADVGTRTRRLRRPTRAIASRFVMATGLRVLPEPCADWFARTVYGAKFLHATVSNMPGPTDQLSFQGIPLHRVYPILPVAPGTPLSLGAMSWTGVLGISLAADPTLLDAEALAARMQQRLVELGAPAEHPVGAPPSVPGSVPGSIPGSVPGHVPGRVPGHGPGGESRGVPSQAGSRDARSAGGPLDGEHEPGRLGPTG